MSMIHSITRQAIQASTSEQPKLTREFLATGGASVLAQKGAPGVRLLTDSERQASLSAFLATRPSGDLWIFGYGSLIWNPALRVAERRIARIQGWHRSFCLSMPVGRGTPDSPGLVLGLDRGGLCNGVAYRIAEHDVHSELPILWAREMLVGGYDPIWTDVTDATGSRFGTAIAFAIDRRHRLYAGHLSRYEKTHRLTVAVGEWGSSADYLFRTIDGLRTNKITDEETETFGHLVATSMHNRLDRAA